MRYDAYKDFEKINHALWILRLNKEVGVKPAVEEVFEESFKIAESCMILMSKIIATTDVTREEWGSLLQINVNQEPVFNIGDEVIYHVPNTKYYAPLHITGIKIIKEGVLYYTDAPGVFKDSDIDTDIYNSMESAIASNTTIQ